MKLGLHKDAWWVVLKNCDQVMYQYDIDIVISHIVGF